jgi:hypothetical protein
MVIVVSSASIAPDMVLVTKSLVGLDNAHILFLSMFQFMALPTESYAILYLVS